MSKRVPVIASSGSADAPPSRWSTTLSRVLTANLVAVAIACTSVYLLVEILYVMRLPLIADEFDGAYDVYQLRSKLPYVDFKPYKTVLGYYLQLPPLLLARNVWEGLLNSKLMLAVINAACMLGTGLIVARGFSARAVALALPFWIVMTDWLERSAELRVDTLTAWAGLFSLLALLAGRPAIAGLLSGLAFLVSQKGFYFFVASGAGLVAVAMVAQHGRSRVHALAWFGAAYALTIGAYLAFWGTIGSLHTTTAATFLSHQSIVFDDIYPNIRRYWWQTLYRNPVFYALVLASLTWLGACVLSRTETTSHDYPEHKRDTMLFGYAFLFATCIIWHKQPWPYFFVLLVPTAFVMHVWLFEHAWSAYERWALAPMLAQRTLAVVVVLGVAGVGLPAWRINTLLQQDNGYQRHMLAIADALTKSDQYYLAAADMLYDRAQTSSDLRRVSLARRRALSRYPVSSSKQILRDLRDRTPKVLIRNERFDAFPIRVTKYLRAHYAPFWGGIDLYAPALSKGESTLVLRFPGQYKLTSAQRKPIRIGDRVVKHGETITLAPGSLQIVSIGGGRLWLQAPELASKLDARFRKRRDFYGDTYGR